jgi:hypothetical protein
MKPVLFYHGTKEELAAKRPAESILEEYKKNFEQRRKALAALKKIEKKPPIYGYEFRLSEIVQNFKIKKSFILNLVNLGIIKPFRDVKGRGRVRGYSFWNVMQVLLFASLAQMEVSYSAAKDILESLEVSLIDDADFIRLISTLQIIGFMDGRKLIRIDFFDPTEEKAATPSGVAPPCSAYELAEYNLKAELITFMYLLDVRNVRLYAQDRLKNL